MKTTTKKTERFRITPTAAGLNICDPWTATECTTTAPAGFVLQLAESAAAADPAWRACDLAGFAERRARLNVTPAQVVDNGRTFRSVAQPDLFAAA